MFFIDVIAFLTVGGIYTVIKTKAGVTVEELGEQYCLIGPYNEACVRTEVEVMEPYNEAMRAAMAQMRDHGIKVTKFRFLEFQMFVYGIFSGQLGIPLVTIGDCANGMQHGFVFSPTNNSLVFIL